MKEILLCNDDGVTSSGILAANEAVKDFGNTTIVAPSKQQSGIGHALTLYEPLRVKKQSLRNGKIAYGVSGTPTDALIIGIFKILNKKPDLVISGINIGYNLGKAELTTSGTLGAAIEAASYKIPTIAVSQEVNNESTKFENGKVDINFNFTIKILKKLSKYILENGLPDNVDLINLNIPSNPITEKVEVSNLTERMFIPTVEKRNDPRGKPYYWIDGTVTDNDKKGTDGDFIKNKNTPTVTPITLNMTGNVNKTKEWFKNFK